MNSRVTAYHDDLMKQVSAGGAVVHGDGASVTDSHLEEDQEMDVDGVPPAKRRRKRSETAQPEL
jgi:hypothetical protein